MSGEDKCREVSIVGGTYQETCYWPVWDELFGSGWRSVRVMRLLCPEVQINYQTVGGDEVENMLKVYAASEKLNFKLAKTKTPIRFYYNHPLATPIIKGGEPERLNLNVSGRHVVAFGMLEAIAQIESEWVVYDPQSPKKPLSFKEQGGKAEHLALVLNKSEAQRLSGETSLEGIQKVLFEKEGCECLVMKCGAEGARVYTSVGDKGTLIPVYKTKHVWPIGSGDVFTTVFAYYWFAGCKAEEAAGNASRAVAAYCEGHGDVDRVADAVNAGTEYEAFVPQKRGTVYLAGPFFTLSEKQFVSEIRNLLKAMGVDVFSPYHDVGEGKAEDVVPKDIEHLKDCACVFAIVDGLDSGTLFEMGYAVAMGKKVVAYVENETEGALKMLAGTGCDIEKDFTTAMYKTCWYAAE